MQNEKRKQFAPFRLKMKPKSNRAFLSGNIGTVCVCWGLPLPREGSSIDVRPFRPRAAETRRRRPLGHWAAEAGVLGHLGTETQQRACTVSLMDRNASLGKCSWSAPLCGLPRPQARGEGRDPEPFAPRPALAAGAPLRGNLTGLGRFPSLIQKEVGPCGWSSEDLVGKPVGLRFSHCLH